ncbi:MAG: amidohydrolase family protein [Psittacicella sp.]
MYTDLVLKGEISLYEALQKMTRVPANIYKLDAGKLEIGSYADLAIFDLETEFSLTREYHKSISQNTPFLDKKLKGRTLYTFVNGELVWKA